MTCGAPRRRDVDISRTAHGGRSTHQQRVSVLIQARLPSKIETSALLIASAAVQRDSLPTQMQTLMAVRSWPD
jgi:hypothetical protein